MPNYFNFGPVPVMTSSMTYREIGNSGLRAVGGYVREEFLPQLQGRQAATMYREMSDNSPVIGGMLFAINAAMKKVQWRVNAADDTPAAQEAADFADSLRTDMMHTWEDSIAEGLSMLTYGFAPQEIVYKKRLGVKPGMDPSNKGKSLPKSRYDDGKIGWKKLPLRGQDTIIKWFFDENGETLGMTQMPYIGAMRDIPIEKMLLFRPSQHKDNPEGRSMIRNAYRSYYMVKRIEEQEAILYERLNGIPVLRLPTQVMQAASNGDAEASALVEQFKRIAINLRIDEQMGVVMPSDTFPGGDGNPSSVRMYDIELVSPGGGKGGGGAVSSNETINRHNNLMMMSVLADFLILGHGPNGTEALADSKKGMFFQATEGFLNSMAAVYNRDGLPRVFELNGMDTDLLPEYAPDMSQEVDLDILSNYILRLSQSGMAIFPNEELESALMDAAGLPDIAESGALDALGGEDAPQHIVGPLAAAAAAAMAPKPDPVEPGKAPPGIAQDSPADKFQKMIRGSMARRFIKLNTAEASVMRKRNLPRPRGSDRRA